jgi:hypothetical protein
MQLFDQGLHFAGQLAANAAEDSSEFVVEVGGK